MKSSEVKRFAALSQRQLKYLKLQGKSDSTMIPDCSPAEIALQARRGEIG